MDMIESLTVRIQTLAPIIAGLKQALTKLELSNEERSVVVSIAGRYGSEYDAARKTLKKLQKQSHAGNEKPRRQKRNKPKSVDNVQLSYQKERDKKIEETHRVSGFNRQWISIVQGGIPGSGKNS